MRKILLALAVLLALAIPAKAADITTTTCPGAGCVDLSVAGQGTISFQITGTWVGTITSQVKVNGAGTTFTSLSCVSYADTTAALVTTRTANGNWYCAIPGAATVRIVFTAFTSGTASVSSRTIAGVAKLGGSGGSSGGITGSIADGQIAIGTGTDEIGGSSALTFDDSGITIQTGTDYPEVLLRPISDGYAGGDVDVTFVAQNGDLDPRNGMMMSEGDDADLGWSGFQYRDTTNVDSTDYFIYLSGHSASTAAMFVNSIGDIGLGNVIPNNAMPNGLTNSNLFVAGDGSGTTIKGDLTAGVEALGQFKYTAQTPPDGSVLTAPALAGAGAGNVNNGTHRYAFTVSDSDGHETSLGSPTSAVTVVNSAADGKVTITVPYICDTLLPNLGIYRDFNGDGVFKLVELTEFECATEYEDNIANASLGAVAPTVTTAFLPYTFAGDTLTVPYSSDWGGGLIQLRAIDADGVPVNVDIIMPDVVRDGVYVPNLSIVGAYNQFGNGGNININGGGGNGGIDGSVTLRGSSIYFGTILQPTFDNAYDIGSGGFRFKDGRFSGTVQIDTAIQAGSYKSSDGTTGVTVTTCTGFKNGLCISGT